MINKLSTDSRKVYSSHKVEGRLPEFIQYHSGYYLSVSKDSSIACRCFHHIRQQYIVSLACTWFDDHFFSYNIL